MKVVLSPSRPIRETVNGESLLLHTSHTAGVTLLHGFAAVARAVSRSYVWSHSSATLNGLYLWRILICICIPTHIRHGLSAVNSSSSSLWQGRSPCCARPTKSRDTDSSCLTAVYSKKRWVAGYKAGHFPSTPPLHTGRRIKHLIVPCMETEDLIERERGSRARLWIPSPMSSHRPAGYGARRRMAPGHNRRDDKEREEREGERATAITWWQVDAQRGENPLLADSATGTRGRQSALRPSRTRSFQQNGHESGRSVFVFIFLKRKGHPSFGDWL